MLTKNRSESPKLELETDGAACRMSLENQYFHNRRMKNYSVSHMYINVQELTELLYTRDQYY